MLREYQHSILFVEKCLHVHKYVYISYEINIRKSLQVDLQVDQKLHEFFFEKFFKRQEVWKLMYHSNFQNKESMYFIVTMSNSHKKSWFSLTPKRELFPMH